MKKHYLLLIRIVLFLSFFTPFLFIKCSCAKKAEAVSVDSLQVDTSYVLVDTTVVIDTAKVSVVNNTNNHSDTLTPVVNDTATVIEKSIVEKMIWPQKDVISGFGIAYTDTCFLSPIFGQISFVTLAFYLSLLLLIFYFLKRKRSRRDLIISILILGSLFLPMLSLGFSVDIKWGFYACAILSLLNLIFQLIYNKQNKDV